MVKDLSRIHRRLSHLQKRHMDPPLPRHMDLPTVPQLLHMIPLHHQHHHHMDLRPHHMDLMDHMEADPHPTRLIRTNRTINGEPHPQKNL